MRPNPVNSTGYSKWGSSLLIFTSIFIQNVKAGQPIRNVDKNSDAPSGPTTILPPQRNFCRKNTRQENESNLPLPQQSLPSISICESHSSMFLIKLIQATWKNIHSKVLMIWKAYQKESRNKIHTTWSIPVFKIIVEFLHHCSCFQQGTLWRTTHSDQESELFTRITKNDFKGLISSGPPILQGQHHLYNSK